MKSFFRSALDAILFSNVFMALCAVAQALVTFHLIDSAISYPVLGLLFASTLCVYNFSLMITPPRSPERSPYPRIRWYFSHYKLMLAVTVLAAVAMVPLVLMLTVKSITLLSVLAVLSFGYSLPMFTKGNYKFGLRNITGLKSLLITLVWTLSCVLLPIFEAEGKHLATIPLNDALILTAKRFMFIAALTIPFDIRDVLHDGKVGLKTIPVMLGEKKAYLFCLFLLTGYVVLLFLFKNNGFNNDFFALSLTAILTAWLIFKSKLKKNEYYYFLYMDGVLILQYILLQAFKIF